MSVAAQIRARAEALHAADCERLRRHTDRLFLVLMLLQWLGGVVAALVVSPRTWIGQTPQVHAHVYAAALLGGALAAGPVLMVLRAPGTALTRHVIALSQVLFSALLIHLTGGRIETHFHVFVSFAFLAFYRDPWILLSATAVVAADHFVRGLFWPESVFGTTQAPNWLWVEHAAWVLFEDVVLIFSIRRSLRDMRESARREARLEVSKEEIEAIVESRTRELDLALREAEEASRCKSAFLANMSHEIRTPMTAILGYADLLEDASRDVDRADVIGTIRRNGRHLLQVINDILDISKLESGQLVVESMPCSPLQLVQEAMGLMSLRAAQRGVRLSLVIGGEIPRTIRSDPTRLQQVLLNLLGNAVKFTERGDVCIILTCDREEELLRVAFIDTGIGMSPRQVGRIFQPFQQSDNSTTRRFGGTGLGLAISRQLAGMLGGDIEVVSAPDRGSTFVLHCATGALEGVEMITAVERVADASPGDVQVSPTLAGRRVLLAEDGEDNRRLISVLLRKAGAVVEIAENGVEAVEKAEACWRAGSPHDLIFMDMQMPEMDGYEATRRLRVAGYPRPIIALTAHAMAGDRERCIDAGCDEYASKPIDRVRLVELVHEWSRASAA